MDRMANGLISKYAQGLIEMSNIKFRILNVKMRLCSYGPA